VDPHTATVSELREQLAQLEQQRADVERALAARHEAAKGEIAAQVRDLIVANGYDIDEILPLVAGKSKGVRRTRGQAPAVEGRAHYVDPDDPSHTYVRGATPAWMRDKMIALGYDPADKDSRDAFKAEHLRRVA
jgi:DNA-binding protein H-NS